MRKLLMLWFCLQTSPARPAGVEFAPGARTDRPIALVGGMLLDGYEAEPIHDAVVVMHGRRIVARK